MKISGIVCEYNPFHNGHLYHISETVKNGATHIAAVMSGNFVQRGEPAVLDKFTRAGLAVRCGADLVIELPAARCLSSAEGFASGAVRLLDSLGCVDELSFGSECGSIAELEKAMENADKAASSPMIKELMSRGMTYPKALCSILDEKSAAIISEPNNLLAVEYIRAIKKLGSSVKPFTIRRSGSAHDSDTPDEYTASASYIRQHPEIAGKYCPQFWADALKSGTADIKRLERAILYRVRTASEEDIAEVADSNGLIEKIHSNKAASLEELFDSVKSRNCTMARVKRVILSLLLGIKKEDTSAPPPYIRVLAFNEKGKEILSAAKKCRKLPLGTSSAKLGRLNADAERFALIEERASDIYSLALENITPAGADLTAHIKKT